MAKVPAITIHQAANFKIQLRLATDIIFPPNPVATMIGMVPIPNAIMVTIPNAMFRVLAAIPRIP